MAGLQTGSPTPTALTVHSQSRLLEIAFSDGANFKIPFELMRIYSPSAEVQGHGPGQEILQTGKREVNVLELEPIGNYAVKPACSPGTTCTNWARIKPDFGMITTAAWWPQASSAMRLWWLPAVKAAAAIEATV